MCLCVFVTERPACIQVFFMCACICVHVSFFITIRPFIIIPFIFFLGVNTLREREGEEVGRSTQIWNGRSSNLVLMATPDWLETFYIDSPNLKQITHCICKNMSVLRYDCHAQRNH